jgi:hypothetical protein
MFLDGANLLHAMFQRGSHLLMHDVWIVAFDEIRGPSVAAQQLV